MTVGRFKIFLDFFQLSNPRSFNRKGGHNMFYSKPEKQRIPSFIFYFDSCVHKRIGI